MPLAYVNSFIPCLLVKTGGKRIDFKSFRNMTLIRPFTGGELERIRAAFPALSEYTFLNAAGMTPLPIPARDAMTSVVADMTQNAYLGINNWVETARAARKAAAQMAGASEREMAFIRNTSDGVSLVASGLRLGEGDEVIINDIEFPSNVYPWLNLARKGVRVITVKSEQGRVTPDAIASAVTPRTKVVAISSVQYLSGYRADLAALGEMAKARGFYLFVDAIQSLGAFPLDVKACGVDFMAAGGFKWMCGPVGSGIFYCDENRLNDLDLARVGWNTVINAQDYADIDFTMRDTAERFEEGSPNVPGIFGLDESMKLLNTYGIERNAAQVISLTDRLVEGLERKGHSVVSPRGEGEKSGIVNFVPKGADDADTIARRLDENKVLVIRRGEGVRVSPHFYNGPEDIDRLLELV